MKSRIYLAYGSNMDLEQMKARCPGAQLLGTGHLDGWQLLFKGSKTGAYATIEQDEDHYVPVLIWRITEEDEKRLDRYEGFPVFYYKRQIPTIMMDEEGKECGRTSGMAYIMREYRPFGLPSSWYTKLLANSYRDFGFDKGILHEALEYTSDRFLQNLRKHRNR